MVFREPGPRPPRAGHVVHGPFPARLALLGGSLAACVVGAMMLLVALHAQRLRCDDAVCRLDAETFPRSDLVGAHAIEQRGSKNAKYGVVVLELRDGRERKLMQVEPEEAEEAARTIRESQTVSQKEVDVRLHGPTVLLPFGAIAVVVAVVFLGIALSKMGRFDLVVSKDGALLLVRRSIFGIPAGARIVPLDRVQRVIVERGSIAPIARRQHEPLIQAARLRLAGPDGERALTRAYYPGHALHLRAAAALRTALSLEPDAKDDAELAALPMRTSTMTERGMFVWIGITTGAILGLAIFGLTLMLLGITTFRANIEGWMVAAGCIPGAVAGAAVAIHATRTRLPR